MNSSWKYYLQIPNKIFIAFLINSFYSFQVPESYLVHYLPSKSLENEGLFHATLGLDFTVEEIHYQHYPFTPKLDFKNINDGKISSEKKNRELWVKCEATMPPLGANKTVYPYTRNVFLGSLAQSFNRFDSILSSSSSSSSSSSASSLFRRVPTSINTRKIQTYGLNRESNSA